MAPGGARRRPNLDPALMPRGLPSRGMEPASQTTADEGLVRPAAQAVGIVALTGTVAAAARTLLHVEDVEMIFLLGVMATALLAGRRASLVAAALSVGVFDWFFVPPFYTLDVADHRYVTTFAVMFLASLVIGTLVLRLREQREEALDRARRTAALHAASRELSGALDLPAVARATCRGAARALGAEAAWFDVTEGEVVRAVAVEPPGAALGEQAAELAGWVAAHGSPAGPGTGNQGSEPFTAVPVRSFAGVMGVLAVQPRDGRAPTHEQRGLLEALAQGAALALDRVRHADEARRASLEVEREALRSQLLSTVSHDLRTPLSSITGAATALREDAGLDAATRRELTDSIVDEAERLERLVGNLLDMTRLEGGAVVPKREWVPVDEVVGSALTRLERRLAGRPVRTELEPDLPLLSVDPVLIEQAVTNLVENAVKHTPAGAELSVSASRAGGDVLLEVADRGPGLPPGEEERIFERFHRGAAAGARGSGLGLPIARAIARVHGGRLVARQREGGGAVFSLTLPVPPGAPVTPGLREGAGVPARKETP
jgi:two-component system sensor histidine kinase KdpD